mgnify:CR=1 FL=1
MTNGGRSKLDWDRLKVFQAVAETGSINAAAGPLAMSYNKVSKDLEALERTLGHQLFDRSNRGLELTAVGEDILRSARSMADTVQAIVDRAGKHSPDELVICAREGIATYWLARRLPELLQLQPDVRVFLKVLPTTPNLSDGDGDIDGKNNNVSPAVVNGSDTATRDVRGFEPNATLPAGKKGWFIDMVKPPTPTAQGERTVSNPRVFGTVLVTASLIPPTNNTCDAGGNGFINALDAFTGTSLPAAFFNANQTTTGGAANFADDTLTSGSDTVAIGSVDLGLGMPTLPTLIDQLLVAGGSTGTLGSIGINPQGSGSRRLSWREILKD